MLRKAAAFSLVAGVLATAAFAQENRNPSGIPHLDHVFLIMMENHGYQQVIGNPNEPYLNSLIKNGQVNLPRTILLSGIRASPTTWKSSAGRTLESAATMLQTGAAHRARRTLLTGVVNADDDLGTAPVPVDTGSICPIAGDGTDAATPAGIHGTRLQVPLLRSPIWME